MEIIDDFNIFTKFPKPFKLLSIKIGEQCDDKYCKVLKRGIEYKFYSDDVDEK